MHIGSSLLKIIQRLPIPLKIQPTHLPKVYKSPYHPPLYPVLMSHPPPWAHYLPAMLVSLLQTNTEQSFVLSWSLCTWWFFCLGYLFHASNPRPVFPRSPHHHSVLSCHPAEKPTLVKVVVPAYHFNLRGCHRCLQWSFSLLVCLLSYSLHLNIRE